MHSSSKNLVPIKDYVGMLAVRRLHERLLRQRSPGRSQDVFALWRAVSLVLWLASLSERKEVDMQVSQKKSYARPELIVFGSMATLTQGNATGEILDQDFPSGTPRGSLTFS
jgi:hypothetical protein